MEPWVASTTRTARAQPQAVRETDQGHSRLVQDRIRTTAVMNQELQAEDGGPAVGQVIWIERTGIRTKTGEVSQEQHDAISRRPPAAALPQERRQHWCPHG